jgi:hypothetical protein
VSIKRIRRRLARVEDALPGPPPGSTAAPPAADAQPLAREIAAAFGRLAEGYRRHYGLSPEEARQRALAATADDAQRILDAPAEQVEWLDLDTLDRIDPALALERWEEVKRAAREEANTGHRAAQAVEGDFSRCWTRARFLALRAELIESIHPRCAVEAHLIDQLAQWQTLLWLWQENLAACTALAAQVGGTRASAANRRGPPLLSEVEATEQAARLVERCHRLYLRTLRALQDQRRAGPVLVRHARQVNVAGQQINVTG